MAKRPPSNHRSPITDHSKSGASFPLRTLASLCLIVCCLAGEARGDALVKTEAMLATTIAEIFVEESKIRVELALGFADARAFGNVLPDEIRESLELPERPLTERLLEFFTEDWVLRADGEILPGRVDGIEIRPRVRRDDITGEPLPAPEGEEPERVLAMVIEYALGAPPATISFKAPLDPDRGTPASVGFVAYHRGVAVNDFRYLSGVAELDLDWDDPWYSSFRHPNLKRQYSDPIQGFLYVEPFEVRKEILVRPKDLQTWIDLDLDGKEVLEADKQEALLEKIAEFFSERCPVTIDGKAVPFELQRAHFVERTLRQTKVFDGPVDQPLLNAMVGLIYAHPRDGLPQEVAMTWDVFNDKITSMRGATLDEAGPLPGTVTPDDPVLTWKNFLKNPTLPTFVDLPAAPSGGRHTAPTIWIFLGLIAAAIAGLRIAGGRDSPMGRRVAMAALLVCLGSGIYIAVRELRPRTDTDPDPAEVVDLADEKAAKEMVGSLLHNIYQAFGYRKEEQVYDALARSVSGDLLGDIYLQVYGALVLQGQGGAKMDVERSEVIEANSTPLEGGGFQIESRWNVLGKVNHWGHTHQRMNQYHAKFTVEPSDGRWKITKQEFLGSKRLG